MTQALYSYQQARRVLLKEFCNQERTNTLKYLCINWNIEQGPDWKYHPANIYLLDDMLFQIADELPGVQVKCSGDETQHLTTKGKTMDSTYDYTWSFTVKTTEWVVYPARLVIVVAIKEYDSFYGSGQAFVFNLQMSKT